jgi:S1-C subfamily serine protease
MIRILIFLAIAALAQAQDLAEKLQNISVTLHASDGAQGSGVLFTRDGGNYVLSAAHVVDGGRKVVTFSDNVSGETKKYTKFDNVKVVREILKEGRSIGKMSIEAEVIAFSSADYGDDLVLLKLRDAITPDSAVFYSGTSIPSVGSKVCHVGSFLGQEGSNSFSEGLVSQVGRVLKEANDHVFDQSSATAFPGSSGGGMFNAQGEYIGTLVRGAGETFNLYVPIRRIKEWAKRHGVEFIFDTNGKPDESKIVLEGLEPAPVSSPSFRETDSETMEHISRFHKLIDKAQGAQ